MGLRLRLPRRRDPVLTNDELDHIDELCEREQEHVQGLMNQGLAGETLESRLALAISIRNKVRMVTGRGYVE